MAARPCCPRSSCCVCRSTIGDRRRHARDKRCGATSDDHRFGSYYAVGLGVTAVDSDDDEQPKEDLSAWFARSVFRTRNVAALATYAAHADSLQIALPGFLPSSRTDLFSLVTALSLRAAAGQAARDLYPAIAARAQRSARRRCLMIWRALRPRVDRLRLLTVEAASGEEADVRCRLDPVGRGLALGKLPGLFDVAVPLYGVDFSSSPADLAPSPTRRRCHLPRPRPCSRVRQVARGRGR